MTNDVKLELRQLVIRLAKTVFNYTVNPTKVPSLEESTQAFLKMIGQVSEDRATEVMKKLQEAMKMGFEKFSEDIIRLEERVKELNSEKTVKDSTDE